MSRFERWSRLKRGDAPPAETAARDDAPRQAETPPREPSPTAQTARETAPSATPPPGSLDHTLPDPDTLSAGSDIKAYLASGVSSGLRKRALRRLFAAEHYGIRDGLDDYDDDFREKLKPLASEVAGRLRDWTRQQLHDDEASPDLAPEDMTSGPEETDEPSQATSRLASQGDTDETPSSEDAERDERQG